MVSRFEPLKNTRKQRRAFHTLRGHMRCKKESLKKQIDNRPHKTPLLRTHARHGHVDMRCALHQLRFSGDITAGWSQPAAGILNQRPCDQVRSPGMVGSMRFHKLTVAVVEQRMFAFRKKRSHFFKGGCLVQIAPLRALPAKRIRENAEG